MPITTKTIVSAAGPQSLPVMDMTIPRAKAETKVPFILPIPPSRMTAKLNRRTIDSLHNH